MKNNTIEKLIKEKIQPFNEAVDQATNGACVEGLPIFEFFYDKKYKGCLTVDRYNLTGTQDEDDRELIKFINLNPERFTQLPSHSAKKDFGIMQNFAYENNRAELISALEGKKPMATFNLRVGQLNLEETWFEFRQNYYDALFKNWAKNNDIEI